MTEMKQINGLLDEDELLTVLGVTSKQWVDIVNNTATTRKIEYTPKRWWEMWMHYHRSDEKAEEVIIDNKYIYCVGYETVYVSDERVNTIDLICIIKEGYFPYDFNREKFIEENEIVEIDKDGNIIFTNLPEPIFFVVTIDDVKTEVLAQNTLDALLRVTSTNNDLCKAAYDRHRIAKYRKKHGVESITLDTNEDYLNLPWVKVNQFIK